MISPRRVTGTTSRAARSRSALSRWRWARLAACSSSGSKAAPTTTTPPITKAALVTKANAICTATEASLKKAEAAVSGSPSQDQVVAFITTNLIPATQSELAKIHALGEPTGDHGQLAAILASMESTLEHGAGRPGHAVSQTNPFAAVDARLRAYGLPAHRGRR